ncbi:MAG TPA: efflux RND transporter periplasmic adaptor subunit, partial [Caulobacteraceae bacterium]|nr:efflux RND transporter periplasmic adaptor subunit [Caulobacteraceae bacterium]
VEFTRVTAPISGIVSDRRVDPGNLIAGGSSAGDILTTIVSTSPIHFTFEASEAQLLAYQRNAGSRGGARVQVRLADEADYRWNGRIDFSDNAVDAGSGAVRMRAVIDNPGGFLKPGLFGRARMEGSAPYTAMLIPETAIVADGPRKVAYVVGADGTVVSKPLQLGPLTEGMRVVRSGLRPDDRVIVTGIQRARPGQKVQVKATRIQRSAEPAPDAPTVRRAPSKTATPTD